MFIKLRNRLLLINMIILSVVVLAAFTVVYMIIHVNIQKENNHKLESMSILTIFSIGEGEASAQPDHPITGSGSEYYYESSMIHGYRRLPLEYNNSFIISVDEQGNILNIYSHLNLPESVYIQAMDIWGKDESGIITLEGRQWQYRVNDVEESRIIQTNNRGQMMMLFYHQIAFLDITDSRKTLTTLMITFLISGVLILAIIFSVSYWVSNRSIKPMEENWNKQKQFVADASHELKTPLAIIEANLDAMRTDTSQTVDSQAKWLLYADTEIERMTALINDMLFLAKAENLEPQMLTFNLTDTIEEAIASMEAVAYEKGIEIKQMLDSEIIMSGDSDKIKQVALILLENAVKYTEKHTERHTEKINVSLTRLKRQAVLSIGNTGKPISEEDLTKIFDRFYRGDLSRTSETGGYGLGLSIAKAIIERMGGRITVESRDRETIFTVYVPFGLL